MKQDLILWWLSLYSLPKFKIYIYHCCVENLMDIQPKIKVEEILIICLGGLCSLIMENISK